MTGVAFGIGVAMDLNLSSTMDPPDRAPLRRRSFVLALGVVYAIVWVALAVSPVDRSDWLLENLLVFAAIAGLAVTRRRVPLSDVSYLLITLFLVLHAFGAHSTYSEVPFGYWLKDTFGLSRNPFDRIVHFSFGLLLAYPVREVLKREAGLRGFWSWYLPVSAMLAWSGLYELIESWVARIVKPELGASYLGLQGDEWDAQKDMGLALFGAIVAMVVTALLERRARRDRVSARRS